MAKSEAIPRCQATNFDFSFSRTLINTFLFSEYNLRYYDIASENGLKHTNMPRIFSFTLLIAHVLCVVTVNVFPDQ